MQVLLANWDPDVPTGQTQRLTNFLSLQDDPAFPQSIGEAELNMRTAVEGSALRWGFTTYFPRPWTVELAPFPTASLGLFGVMLDNMQIISALIMGELTTTPIPPNITILQEFLNDPLGSDSVWETAIANLAELNTIWVPAIAPTLPVQPASAQAQTALFDALDVSAAVPGQVAAMRVALDTSGVVTYPGNALTDDLADLFAFFTSIL